MSAPAGRTNDIFDRAPYEESLTVNDAMSVVSYAVRHTDEDVDVRDLVAAGATLAAHVREQRRELERERARVGVSRDPHVSRVEGGALIEKTDAGGPRHYLSGAPVHAGDGICLLTKAGWLAGRYEWEWKPATPPRFFFCLPGVDAQVSIALPVGTRLAWPDEIEPSAS